MMAEKKTAEAPRRMAKSAVYKDVADRAGLTAAQVSSVFDALEVLIKQQLTSKKGPGQFVIPNLLNLRVVKKPATKATKKPTPFKPGEMMDVKAKPASTKVKAVLLKGLKELKA